MSTFNGKVAIVTGGGSGIGRATALAFAREGARVVVAGRRSNEGEETVRQIVEKGGEAVFIQTDVSKEKDVESLVKRTIKIFGRLDYAFNNAGVEQIPGAITEQNEEIYDQIMDINVKGVWLSMKYQIPEILKQGGAIVNNSSVAGLIGFGGAALYAASKHAVVGMSKSVALEYAAQGLRVNVVNPAAIETDMFNRFVGDDENLRSQMQSFHPIGRVGKSEEIADAVIWLCSDKSSFVTGIALAVDGGFTAH